jgi:hypothetical protein
MRVNSHMTWRARQILRRWTAENGLAAGGPLSALDGVPAQGIEWLAVRVYRWLVNPHRKLVTGITLADLAGDDLPQYEDDAELRLGGFAKQAADRGAQFGLALAAAHGALGCPHWWGHPRWPDLVDRLLIVLDDPANEHRGQAGSLGDACRPSRPSWRTGSSFAGYCGGARGSSAPRRRGGWSMPVSATCGPSKCNPTQPRSDPG